MILLVMPKTGGKLTVEWPVLPIGMAYVSAALKAAGYSVYTVNLEHEKKTLYEVLYNIIKNNNIKIVGTGGLVVNYNQIKNIIDCVKDIDCNLTTIIGGSLVTDSPIVSMKGILNADYGIIGEGEETICELVDAILYKKNINQVSGLIYKQDKKLIFTKKREEIKNLDSITFPDYDGFNFIQTFNGKAVGILTTSRSCPNQCTFCSKSGGRKYRQRSLTNIFEEIDLLVSKYNIKRLMLNDELFSYCRQRIFDFTKRIKKYNLQWSISLRVNGIEEDILRAMKESGCISVGFGLESADNKILKSMNKHITREEIEKALSLAKKVGLAASGNFIFGDIEETKETAMHTIAFWKSHPEYDIYLAPIICYPGSMIYNYAVKNNIIKDELQYIESGCPPLNISKMSDKEYDEILSHIKNLLVNKRITLAEDNIVLKNLEDGSFIVNYSCRICNLSQSLKYSVNDFQAIIETSCSSCGTKNYLNLISYIKDSFEENISEIIKKEKIILYGMTEMLVVLLHFSEYLRTLIEEKKVYLVDGWLSKNEEFCGHLFYTDDILKKTQPCLVIITTKMSSCIRIKNMLNILYPDIKKIQPLHEFFNIHF